MTATSRSDVRHLLRTACQACRASFNHSSRGRWASHGERSAVPPPDPAPASQRPLDLLRSRSYLVLLVFGAAVGVPVAVIAYYFLKLVALAPKYFFTTLPGEMGFHGQPPWWPVPVVAVGGLLVALTLHYLPGTGGHHPAEGFKAGGGG